MISGDTAPTQALIDHSRDCDVLIHEAYSIVEARNTGRGRRRNFVDVITHRQTELAEIANVVKPGLLVTYHRAQLPGEPHGPQDALVEEIQQAYDGKVVAAQDLEIF